jgi:hypothetical protein
VDPLHVAHAGHLGPEAIALANFLAGEEQRFMADRHLHAIFRTSKTPTCRIACGKQRQEDNAN